MDTTLHYPERCLINRALLFALALLASCSLYAAEHREVPQDEWDIWEEPELFDKAYSTHYLNIAFYWDTPAQGIIDLMDKYGIERALYRSGTHRSFSVFRRTYGRLPAERHPDIEFIRSRTYDELDPKEIFRWGIVNPAELKPRGLDVYQWYLGEDEELLDKLESAINAEKLVVFAELNRVQTGHSDGETGEPPPTLETVIGGAPVEDGWRYLKTFGYYLVANMNSMPYGYLMHDDLGWLYILPASEGFWFYDVLASDWFWTSVGPASDGAGPVFPYMYRQDGDWYFYAQGTESPRWFYNITRGEWLNL